MQFICLMGITGSGKSTLENALEAYGFKRSISYTTREPREENGVLERDGNEYKFVTEDRFKALVDAKAIIEYEKYNNHYYGTPEPIGADRHVAVVCLKGYKALKKKYGEQVIGVYIKCNKELSLSRIVKRHPEKDIDKVKARLDTDMKLAEQIEKSADITIKAEDSLQDNIRKVLNYARLRRDSNKHNDIEDIKSTYEI